MGDLSFNLRLFLFGLMSAIPMAVVARDEPRASDAPTSAITVVTTVTLLNGVDFAGWEFHFQRPEIDPSSIWSIEAGELRCTGAEPGYIRTNSAYRDYVLELEWRWAANPGNSGVLLHGESPDKVWPRSIEAQLENQRAGDVWLIDGSRCDQAGRMQAQGKPENYIGFEGSAAENPAGQWNRYQITCRADEIEIEVNGRRMNTLTGCSPRSGWIGLQSEGSPITFRGIRLIPLAPEGK